MSSPRQEDTPLLFLLFDEAPPSPRNNFLLGPSPNHRATRCFGAGVMLVFIGSFLTLIIMHALQPTLLYTEPGVVSLENNTRIFIVHHGGWHSNQVRALEDIIKNYPNTSVDLVELWNATQEGPKRVKRDRRGVDLLHIDMDMVNLDDLLSNENETIHYSGQSLKDTFNHSPFLDVWTKFDWQMAEFAARVASLWEDGGISIKLPDAHLRNGGAAGPVVRTNLTTFQDSPSGVVHIDNEAMHMETKTPCHAFFGEMIRNIRKYPRGSVRAVLNRTLKIFHSNGDISEE